MEIRLLKQGMAYSETVQENAYALICRSFSCIKVTSAAQMLGIPHEALATGKSSFVIQNVPLSQI